MVAVQIVKEAEGISRRFALISQISREAVLAEKV